MGSCSLKQIISFISQDKFELEGPLLLLPTILIWIFALEKSSAEPYLLICSKRRGFCIRQGWKGCCFFFCFFLNRKHAISLRAVYVPRLIGTNVTGDKAPLFCPGVKPGVCLRLFIVKTCLFISLWDLSSVVLSSIPCHASLNCQLKKNAKLVLYQNKFGILIENSVFALPNLEVMICQRGGCLQFVLSGKRDY